MLPYKADGRREIERSEYAKAVAENAQRYKDNKELYRKRQEWNEHIFGTIKRKWGYNYTNLKGLEKVNGEHSLICLVYNMKRTINILGFEKLMEKLKNWTPNYKGILLRILKRASLEPFYEHQNMALTYNLKKLMKFSRPKANILAQALQKTTNGIANTVYILMCPNTKNTTPL